MADQSTQPNVDLVLSVLVKAVNKGETANLGISLLIGGSWLVGSMIGGRMWFDQLAHLIAAKTAGEGGELFHKIGETAYPSESERLAGGQLPVDADPGFIHLRAARLLSGAAVRVPDPGGLVRVKLSSVDGWLVGILDPRLSRPAPVPAADPGGQTGPDGPGPEGDGPGPESDGPGPESDGPGPETTGPIPGA